MGIRNTEHEKKVAMFDSSSGLAFGPVFDDVNDLDDFLDWASAQISGTDLRLLPVDELTTLHNRFQGIPV